MTSTSDIHDPLDINLPRQVKLFLSTIPASSPYALEISQTSATGELLATLSKLLAIPAFTQAVASIFRPILYELCVRMLEREDEKEQCLVALCLLLEVHEELFPILNKLLAIHFKEGPLGFINTSFSPLSINIQRLQCLLVAYYRILQANRELPTLLYWSLAPLSRLIWTPHLDNGVRLLSIRCYALQSGMSEAEREKLETEILGNVCGVDCDLNYGVNVDGTQKTVDGWIMPVIEMERVKEEREAIATNSLDFYAREEGDTFQGIDPSELSPLTANVRGIFLLRSSTKQPAQSSLVATPTSEKALRALATHLSLRVPTLITSPPSAGKSLLLSHLANAIHPGEQHQIITIHLADTSLDPRALLGSYFSSPTRPGTFEWKEGVIVRSMREGKWIVFEEIDRGSSEVLGVIKPLVESLRLGKWIGDRASIEVPGHGRVVAHDNFMLFATRSLIPSSSGIFTSPSFFGAHKFHEVVLGAPSPEELRSIIDSRFPRLAGSAAQAIINLWCAVKALGSAASARNVGLRELEKFCARVEKLLPASHHAMDISDEGGNALSLFSVFPHPLFRENMYLEARDVFFGAGTPTTSARAHVQIIAAVIGEHLGFDADKRELVLLDHVPTLHFDKDVNGHTTAVLAGNTRLSCHTDKMVASYIGRPFAMHRPAISLITRIATAVSLGEPVLLTGETGTGKTSVVTHLASLLRRPLISLNLSHQTETADLIGGLKPVDARVPATLLQERFMELFGATFSRRKNEKFETEVRKAVNEGKWKRAVGLWKESTRMAKERIQAKRLTENINEAPDAAAESPRKRRKVDQNSLNNSQLLWDSFLHDVGEFDVQHVQGKGKFAFGFVEGPLVKALRSGDWVLLDELNLASSETLECVSSLLNNPTASITLTENGFLEPVPRHPGFHLFACMNPATDVGKKDLPPNIRSRFTEIDVLPPDADKETLLSIINHYIGQHATGDKGVVMNVAEFYIAVKQLQETRQIADGSNHTPHFSMRNLARALTFASDTAKIYSLRRSVWEGCLMAFTMVLNSPSAEVVMTLAHKYLLSGVRNPRSILNKEPAVPSSHPPEDFVKLGPFYLEKGPLPEDPADDYIITPSVNQKLVDLARIILTRRFPILIEGPTSAGKTSSVEYLARRTGHRFIRINNHEHTDIQEYIGSYVSDPLTGKLVFQDGLLVRALRRGDWIVLDELNLAPSDVLEALNRLLDDNRELVVPETQEVIQPHPHFLLFATQNPPGLYAGRKILSRAFRNRFLEVHFEDVPKAELEMILCQRCQIAPSYGKRIVAVFQELQKRRQTARVFESKHGFATLRDLFRWAGRDAIGYQELADNGYMLLAERTRREDDKIVVKEVIESIMGVKINADAMYDLKRPDVDIGSYLGFPISLHSGIVWTKAMQRLYTLVCRALKYNEPVLLVGETGSGKTSVCQIFADAFGRKLHSLNCHQNTETADLIGGLRPVRNRGAIEAAAVQEVLNALHAIGVTEASSNHLTLSATLDSVLKSKSSDLTIETCLNLQELQRKLCRTKSVFEWHDGPLVEAMRNGDVFLLDEISLADDSVLERLNSVLEPSRSMVLAERGGADAENSSIRASESFKLVATMNPGGDFGKKELSPALRNRFTEIWVPRVEDRQDLELIVGSLWKHEALRVCTTRVLDFVEWLCIQVGDRSLMSLRDIIAWVVFSNTAFKPELQDSMSIEEIFHHAAYMTYLDGLNSSPQLSSYSSDALLRLKRDSLQKLQSIAPVYGRDNAPFHDPAVSVQLGSFALLKGTKSPSPQEFNLSAPTSRDNAMRVVRACQVNKPILLEGSPGVGKTSLITALANISGHELCRINLSDQTDLVDLFGSDLPVEDGAPGEFAWRNAEFMIALQKGHWVLLDEMNLAPQAVLEGLNAILDHRGTVYIPELGRSFTCHPSFRIFAAQNPLSQGGGRKGLPKSFVNRFTKVYIEELSENDLYLVCKHIFPQFDENVLRAMISFNVRINEQVAIQRAFARDGSPWEFNLRDVVRWGMLLRKSPGLHPASYLQTVYLQRFRSLQDRYEAQSMFDKVFSIGSARAQLNPQWSISAQYIQFGHFLIERQNRSPVGRPGRIMKTQLLAMESLGNCISQSWLAIITGKRDSGKTNLIRVMADFTGRVLREISVNNATDTMDILGSFEQVDVRARALILSDNILALLDEELRTVEGTKLAHGLLERSLFLRQSYNHKGSPVQELLVMASSIAKDLSRINISLNAICGELEGKIETLLAESDGVGRFEWVDGPLVQAMKSGDWVLMDGANLCNPSVLDRLNSLCEPGGSLTLSERGFVNGQVQVLKPHPNFRLFMSIDPQFGELSRAMRNRGIEIALITQTISDDLLVQQEFLRLPSMASHMNTKSQCIEFDAARRGLSSLPPLVSRPSLVVSSGRSLNQDSALSSLTDQGPALVKSIYDVDSLIFFLGRTIIPSYIPHFSRYMAAISVRDESESSTLRTFLKSFPDTLLTASLTQFRDGYTTLKDDSSTFILAQPMDFYILSPSTFDAASDLTSSHITVMNLLELSASLFLEEQDALRLNDHTASEASATVQRALSAVLYVLEAIREFAFNALARIARERSLLREKHVELALLLVKYARYLRKAAGTTSFDFSAVQAILHWMMDVTDNGVLLDSNLKARLLALSDVVSLTSGLGLMEIWSAFFSDGISKLHSLEFKQIEMLACGLHSYPTTYSVRRQTFDVIALITAPAYMKDRHEVDNAVLKSKLDDCMKVTLQPEIQYDILTEAASLVVELIPLTLCGRNGHDSETKILKKFIEEILELNCLHQNCSLLRLIPYQHHIWALGMGKNSISIMAQAESQWLDSIWRSRLSDDIIGPSMLFLPVQLYSSILISDVDKTPLLSLSGYERGLHRHVRLVLMLCKENVPRIERLNRLLFQSIAMVVGCFASTFKTDICQMIRDVCLHKGGNQKYMLSQVIALVSTTRNEALSVAVQNSLGQVINNLDGTSQRRVTQSDLGLCWIAVSRLLLSLLVPNTPIDPAAVQNCTTNRLQSEESSILSQIRLHAQLEEITNGNTSNIIVDHLTQRLRTIRSELSITPIFPFRNDVSRLHMFWKEFQQFQSSVISPAKIDALVDALKAQDVDALLREKVTQESLVNFCQRLDTIYEQFADINLPLKFAILHLQMGLRFIAHSHVENNSSANMIASIFRALVSFPSIVSSNVILSNPSISSLPGVSPFQYLQIKLSAIGMEKSIGMRRRADEIESIYEQALRLWLIDQAKEEERSDAAHSLYRRTNTHHDPVSEVDLEEQEFLELFPSFENSLEHQSQGNTPHHFYNVPKTEVPQFVELHYHLFEQRATPTSTSTTALAKYNKLRASMVQPVLRSHCRELPDTMDYDSTAFQLTLLRRKISELSTLPPSDEVPYNFYTDPHLIELNKAASIVGTLRNRILSLIEEWPDQMVLHHLVSRCDLVLNYHLSTPVAKVLSSIEQLLVQTDDWEMYSNQDNTLKVHRQALTSLIVDWRRLELTCWHGLLESQYRSFGEEASEWWFRLYDAVVRGAIDSYDRQLDGENSTTDYLGKLLPLLDDFISTSPIGQFHERMRLLQSFHKYASFICDTKLDAHCCILKRVSRVLHATWKRYALFYPQLSAYLSQHQTALEDEIKKLIKLASWKDVNVQALKQSAQRSHHQLFKIVKKFRAVLRQPISTQLHLQPVVGNETKPLKPNYSQELEGNPDGLTLPEIVPGAKSQYISHLKRTFGIFSKLIHVQLFPFIQSQAPDSVDSFAVDIITTTKQFASISIPQNLSPEKREKQQKAVLVRKRKAWSDLLKELKRAGMSSHPKPDILRQQMDPVWVRDQPTLLDDTEFCTEKIQNYFLRLCILLPDLRSAFVSHHADLGTRELQRGIMLLESGFSMAIESRSRLATALRDYKHLESALRRLQTLEGTHASFCGTNIVERVSSVRNIICGLSSGLQEVSQGMLTLDEVETLDKIPGHILKSVDERSALSDDLRDRLIDLHDTLEFTPIRHLTPDERNLITETIDHVSRTSAVFNALSSQEPRLSYLLTPVNEWISGQHILTSLPPEIGPVAIDAEIENIVEILMISVQTIASLSSDKPGEDDEDSDNYLLNGYRLVCKITRMLRLDAILVHLNGILCRLVTDEDLKMFLERVFPFYQIFIGLVKHQLMLHCQWTKAFFKLNFVLYSVLHTLTKQGFCKPPEGDDANIDGNAMDATGMGLGEGSGSDNVSKEIEEESQVEGLQGEDMKNGEGEGTDDGDAVEMSEDFGGSLEDVPDSGSQEDAESGDESDGEIEEKIEQLDASDSSLIDEKLWGDEKGPSDSNEQVDKTGKDHSKKEEGVSDVVAKEGTEQHQSQDEVKDSAEQDAQPDAEQPLDDEGGEAPNANGAPMDDYIQDANTLDLPDNMDLGEEDMDGGDIHQGEGIDEVSEDMLDEPLDQDTEDVPMSENCEEQTNNGDSANDEVDDKTMEGECEEDETMQKDETAEALTARPDIAAGEGDADPSSDANMDGENSSGGEIGNSRANAGERIENNDKAVDEDGPTESSLTPLDNRNAGTHGNGSEAVGSQAGQGVANSQVSSFPLRSLGDVLKEVQHRFEEILNATERSSIQEHTEEPSVPFQVEYLNPDDADTDMQALGSAGEEQVAKLDQLKLVDDEISPHGQDAMDLNAPPVTEYDLPSKDQGAPQFKPNSADETVESALMRATPLVHEIRIGTNSAKPEVDLEDDIGDTVEMHLKSWQAADFPDEGAENIWRLYESMTHDLANALCEQLRLILEPTLATRLKGDYRTGKRLNMKKIIPYIASDYTKDKIWLRRTRPSQREYQVLIAIDDSKSMAESHSIHLAYETLALISKALSRLEVGDIAIAKFGESVDILHGFNEGPFTDQAGTKVINAFRFRQKATNVLSLVETSLKVLETSRDHRSMSSASAADLWQLEIILSDGMCQDHEKLRATLRRAEEQRVMVVFIILDSLHSNADGSMDARRDPNHGSILSMEKAEYKVVNGRTEIQIQKYLDSFPFEYYVVLRDVEALPDVLAGTLKQYFEKISED